MTYEELIIECTDSGIDVVEKEFKSNAHALIKGNKIAIRKNIPTLCEKSCILVEEMGHHKLTVGDITNINIIENYKQELKARMWGYDKKIGLVGIINAYEARCTNLHETAQFLDVTESYLREALETYRKKYGIYKKIDNYIIYFEPCLGVLELFENKTP